MRALLHPLKPSEHLVSRKKCEKNEIKSFTLNRQKWGKEWKNRHVRIDVMIVSVEIWKFKQSLTHLYPVQFLIVWLYQCWYVRLSMYKSRKLNFCYFIANLCDCFLTFTYPQRSKEPSFYLHIWTLQRSLLPSLFIKEKIFTLLHAIWPIEGRLKFCSFDFPFERCKCSRAWINTNGPSEQLLTGSSLNGLIVNPVCLSFRLPTYFFSISCLVTSV